MKFDRRRVQTLRAKSPGDGPVLYLMAREQRVHDNWALLYAQDQARSRNTSLLVAFVVGPMFNHGTARHNEWMVSSLQDVAQQLATYNIPFLVRCGEWVHEVPKLVHDYAIGHVVFDFNPLEPVRTWREQVATRLSVVTDVVDARNIVPCWQASQKAEFAAYTFRPKVTRLLSEFLVPFPPVVVQPSVMGLSFPGIDWEAVRRYRTYDSSIPIPSGVMPGETAGRQALADFITKRLGGYATKRNDPNQGATSRLSAYLRWGNLSAARVALSVQVAKEASSEDREAFLEELIVRRELTDNYCYYTKDYATVSAAHAWAKQTIGEHAGDKRPYEYTYDTFARAETHDPLWNAAQRQMVQEGYMHGYLRMYWAKKILEWTPNVQTAIDYALPLNDTYQLDGRDSNGVVGVMWSIAGVHDRAWTERPIFGKIRYMNYTGCKRKFDVTAFEARYPDNGTLL